MQHCRPTLLLCLSLFACASRPAVLSLASPPLAPIEYQASLTGL